MEVLLGSRIMVLTVPTKEVLVIPVRRITIQNIMLLQMYYE
jgi:hypothetical protein